MTRIAAYLTVIFSSVLLWHECGEDIAVFCYRIGQGALTTVRSRALVPVPASQETMVRTRAACSNPSSISFTRFMTSKD